MDTPNFRVILLSIVYIAVLTVGLFFLSLAIYDQNYPINSFVDSLFKGGDESGDPGTETEDYLVIDFADSQVSSENLLYLFYLADEGESSYLVMADSFDNLNDKTRLAEINNHVKSRNNYFFLSLFKGVKGLSLFGESYLLDKNRLVYFDTKESFVYSNSRSDIEFGQLIEFLPAQLAVFSEKIGYFDHSNVDLFFKFNDKYLPTLPLQVYIYEKGKGSYGLKDLKFGFSRLYAGESDEERLSLLSYDQKGRASIFNVSYRERALDIDRFDNWNDLLNRRRSLLNELTKLGLFSPEKSGYELFLEEESYLQEIYNLDTTADDEIAGRLDLLKARAGEWNAFKEAGKLRFKGKALILTGGGEQGWIDNFINQKDALSGQLMGRMSVPFNALIAILVFLVNILLCIFFNRRLFYLLVLLGSSLLGILFYLIFRLWLGAAFPIILYLLSAFVGLGMGLILRFLIDLIWKNSVFHIYKESISDETNKLIVDFWRNSDWRFELKDHVATFLMVDTRAFVNNSASEEDVEIISSKTADIEDTLKGRHGVIDSLDPRRILAYFGNPPIIDTHVNDALDSALEISNISIVLDSGELNLYTALHSKKEWFKMVKRKGELHYSHFGTSLSILPAMLRVARAFEVPVVISDNVYKVAKGNVKVRMLDRIRIQGVEDSIRLFELLDEQKAQMLEGILDYFHAGLKLFEKRKWKEAAAYFKQCLKLVPEDLPSEIYLKRAQDFLYVPPGDDWDGIYEVEY